MGVYRYVAESEALADTEGVVIDVRWVIVNKGTQDEPNVRCRLVGREFADKGNRGYLFAGTLPLVSIRILLSLLAMRVTAEKDIEGMVIDVKGAFLYGRTKRSVYIWLPKEDKMGEQGFMGKLERAMYGTRDAPQVWQEEVRKTMDQLGFKECVAQPGIYVHLERTLQVISHVGDFLCVGPQKELIWFRKSLEERYDIKSKSLSQESSMVSFLGREIRWTSEGIEFEADRKHVNILLKEWGLEDCNHCDTPVENVEMNEGSPMSGGEATLFRRAVARINYLSQDRPDLCVASRILAMRMATPRKGDESLIKWTLRYLKGHPRMVYQYGWSSGIGGLTLYTDSDWAGEKEKRRSTSGGVIFHGSHLVGHWSKLQSGPAPSSGEAELNAGAKGLSEVLSIRHLLCQLGMDAVITHYIDASAAKQR